MEKQEALMVLEKYQSWRRGTYPYDEIGHVFSCSPREIGEAIDIAIEELKK